VRLNNFTKAFLLLMAPMAFFWGCSKSNLPVSLASNSSASITVPLKDSHGKDLASTQVSVLYYIGGSGAPVTGNAGTASASTGNSFSFDVKLPTGNTYSYVAVQINDSGNNMIAAGATTMAGGTVPVTLGPVNKPVYQVTLGAGSAFGFESDIQPAVGLNTPTTVAGLDVVCNTDSTGFELDDPALANDTVAYLGNGNFVNYLQIPTTFAESSSTSKSQFATGPSSMAPGDVYCVKLSGGGHAWLQVVSVSAAGPAFVYRVNTTLPYCGYEQTTADLASSLNPTPTVGASPAAVTVAVAYSSAGIVPYDVAVLGPTSGPATTVLVPNSANGYICIFDASTASFSVSFTGTGMVTPIGMTVDPQGSFLYVADPGGNPGPMVNQFSINGGNSFPWNGCIGNGLGVSGTDNSTQAGAGALAKPRYVAFDNSSNLFITDTGTAGFADVMEYFGPAIPLTSITNPSSVNYWAGPLSTGSVNNGVGQIVAAGPGTMVVADSINNRIVFCAAANGSLVAPSITSDNNPAGAVAFSNPQGVAYSASTGYIYISDTGHNRIVEMTLSGAFVKILGPTLGSYTLSGPTGIKLDNAQPPNIYVADTGNGKVVMLQ